MRYPELFSDLAVDEIYCDLGTAGFGDQPKFLAGAHYYFLQISPAILALTLC